MNDEQRYLFDLQGFVVLKNVVSPALVTECDRVLDTLEAATPDAYPANVARAKPRTDTELYLSNIVEAAPVFHELIDIPQVIDIVREVSLGLFRLNHTYAIYHWGKGYTPLHMAGTPMHPKATYDCRGSEIFSVLTKAVFPLRHHDLEDGCFAAIPGSHKANFARPFPDDPDANEALVALPAQPGDAIIFTEALTHGSLINRSGRERRTVFYCYSVGYMPDWTKLGLTFSDSLYNAVNESQREILRLKVT